ncbi:uncharacterized protein Z519_04659 [Cladophialophora bantiana CBS 173.52]|uniref:Major facilitator superfamily (MFS) profile domain-containing protein n=1 Tax=Cladophialophora bantiana (strain ATCC 10958 / CBS 173.52 / CDC B-1940 / NIH 8579) TaxID=1442370 RepID=A0A0D2G7R5_CLAB1|nr:uncharacterized protein Z519_04659 [Cladophialophora bantiana CBS 173.52]KIW94682.1 hypothetical protein Z519_04659 [Cladophialophora bantiana CBS 173.52]
MNLLSIIATSTLSGFTVHNATWTVQYWYNVGIPQGDNPEQPILPRNYIQCKLAIYGCTKRITPPQTCRELAFTSVLPVLIDISPVGALIGLFLIAMFSWAVVIAPDTSIYLQTPVKEGGYGFMPYQNVYCSLSYSVECFTDHPNEVVVVVNLYRLVFGIAVTFFIFPWSDAGGINWPYGMMAFFTAGSFIPISVLMLWGPDIRARSLTAGKSDDGVKVSIKGHSDVIKA